MSEVGRFVPWQRVPVNPVGAWLRAVSCSVPSTCCSRMGGRSTWFPRPSLWKRRSADYETTCAASAIAEVARVCSFEDAEDPFTFAITQRALALVGSGLDTAHMDLLVAAFVFKLLSHVGCRPDFSACVLCGDPMLSYFSPQAGGLMCGSCASSVPGAELVSTGEVAWLRALMSMTFDALMAERIDPHTAAFLLGLSHVWAATHTDQRLRAMEFMLGR